MANKIAASKTEPKAVSDDAVTKAIVGETPEDPLKIWFRANLLWVQHEIEFAKMGLTVDERAKRNP